VRKVIVLSEYFPDEVRPSRGIFVLEQTKALSSLANITVVAPLAEPLPRKKFRAIRDISRRIPARGRLQGVKFFRPRYLDWPRLGNYLNAYGMLFAVGSCIRRNHLECDLIHAHFAHRMGYVGVLLGALLRKPVILTVHGSDINLRPRFRPDRKRILFALRRSRTVITVSDALRASVIHMGISEHKVVTIYNGVDAQQFTPIDTVAARNRLRLPTNAHLILFVGNLHPKKGTRHLIEACARLPALNKSFRLVIVGDGPERARLEGAVSQLGLAEHITFAGEQPHGEIRWWMNACDVFVLPSLHEGFGIVSLEALACGKPVVATAVGGIPEIISSPALGMLVEPANPTQLAEAITAALSEEWDRDSLARYAAQYSWARAAQHISSEYERGN
jgi:glycosyltransferase involved in cell wall biosynthesis